MGDHTVRGNRKIDIPGSEELDVFSIGIWRAFHIGHEAGNHNRRLRDGRAQYPDISGSADTEMWNVVAGIIAGIIDHTKKIRQAGNMVTGKAGIRFRSESDIIEAIIQHCFVAAISITAAGCRARSFPFTITISVLSYLPGFARILVLGTRLMGMVTPVATFFTRRRAQAHHLQQSRLHASSHHL